MRTILVGMLLAGALCTEVVAAPPGPPNAPDLDVTGISITPRLPSYAPVYHDGSGHPTDPNTGQEITLEQAQAIPHYHQPGETVTFTAHVVNHGGIASAPFSYTWSVDGVPFQTGSSPALTGNAYAGGSGTYTVQGLNGNPNGYTYHIATLSAGTFQDFKTQWAWQDGPHTVTFSLAPTPSTPAEISTRNNSRTEWTDAMAFLVTVRRTAYNAFRSVKNFSGDGSDGYPPGPGSYSFEDLVNYYVDSEHDKFRKSVYPTAPNGIQEHIRIDTLLILDDTEPNSNISDLRAVNGYDGTWPFEQYDTINASQRDWGLLHEWGHQLGLMDIYNLDIIPSEVLVKDVDGFNTGLGRTAHQGGMMREHGDTTFSEYDAVGLNSQLGRRRGWYADFQYLIPAQNRVRVLDNTGQPVAGAEVIGYQSKPVTNTPVFQGTTDANGYWDLPNRPAPHITTEYKPGASIPFTEHDNPLGTVDVVGNGNILLFRVRSGAKREFFWLDSTDFERAWFSQSPSMGVFTFQTHLPAAVAPAPPTALTARAVSDTQALLNWSVGPDNNVTGYRVYKGVEPEYAWQLVRTLPANATTYTDTLASRQMARYAVSAIAESGESAFSNEVGVYTYGDMRGITETQDGTVLVADYPREQPIWLRPDFSPMEAFGSVHNHVATTDVATLPDGFIASVGGPVGYQPGPASGLLVVPPDGSDFNGQPNRSRVVRTNGPAATQWNIPEGVRVGQPGPVASNDVLVTDTGNHRVEVMAGDDQTSKRIFGALDLLHPVRAVQLSDRRYVVTDRDANALVIFDSTGAKTGVIPVPGPTYLDSRPSPALAGTDTIAVSESASNTVALLKPDGTGTGTFTTADNVAFSRPSGVAFARDGTLLVADAGNRRVVRLNVNGATPYGDVNGDGVFDGADVRLAFQIAAGLTTSDDGQVVRGDVLPGKTRTLDTLDAATLLRRLHAQ